MTLENGLKFETPIQTEHVFAQSYLILFDHLALLSYNEFSRLDESQLQCSDPEVRDSNHRLLMDEVENFFQKSFFIFSRYKWFTNERAKAKWKKIQNSKNTNHFRRLNLKLSIIEQLDGTTLLLGFQ